MNRQVISAALSLFLAFTPFAVQAQSNDADTCGLAKHPELLRDTMMMMLGPWQVNHQSGYVIAGGMTIPFPSSGDTDIVTLERAGNDLIATHPEMQQPMVFTLTEEPAWAFLAPDVARGLPAPTLTSDDLELLTGCNMSDMPRLIGKTTATLDGVTMDFTWRLVILDTNSMFVVQHIEGVGGGMAYYSRRTVTLTR